MLRERSGEDDNDKWFDMYSDNLDKIVRLMELQNPKFDPFDSRPVRKHSIREYADFVLEKRVDIWFPSYTWYIETLEALNHAGIAFRDDERPNHCVLELAKVKFTSMVSGDGIPMEIFIIKDRNMAKHFTDATQMAAPSSLEEHVENLKYQLECARTQRSALPDDVQARWGHEVDVDAMNRCRSVSYNKGRLDGEITTLEREIHDLQPFLNVSSRP